MCLRFQFHFFIISREIYLEFIQLLNINIVILRLRLLQFLFLLLIIN